MTQNHSNYSTKNEGDSLAEIQFVVFGILGCGICILGFIGNILTLHVLSHSSMRRSNSSIYLISLAICDILILIGFFLIFSLPTMKNEPTIPNYTPYIYSLCLVSQTCAVYIIVGFTIERFIVIRYPLKNLSLSAKRTIKTVIIIVTCSFLYNIPRMMEAIDVEVVGIGNETNNKITLKSHPLYKAIYLTYLYPWVMFILPFITLLILNTWLLITIKRSWKNNIKAKKFDSNQHSNTANKSHSRQISSKEINLNVMIVGVVFTFLICQFLPMIDNIIINYYGYPHILAYYVFYTISSTFVALNSAINFLLYCFIGRKFRQVLFSIYCNKSTIVSQMNNTAMQETVNPKTSQDRSFQELLVK